MERRIRRLGVFILLCFLALFIQLNNIQVIKAHEELIDRLKLERRIEDPPIPDEKNTRPLIDFYKKRGLLVTVIADGSPEEIYERTLKELDVVTASD